MYFDIEVFAISKQSYIEDYFNIKAEIHIGISQFCTTISKCLRYRSSPISKVISILKHSFIYGYRSSVLRYRSLYFDIEVCTSISKIDIEAFIDSFGSGSCRFAESDCRLQFGSILTCQCL
jgi:hypothetical protein